VPKDRRQEEEEDSDELSTSKGHEEKHEQRKENASLLEEFERVAAMASSGNSRPEAIISHDCFISNDVVQEVIRTATTTADTDIKTETELMDKEQVAEPSAPTAPLTSAPLVQYPNLQPMRLTNALIEEQQSQIVYRSQVARSPGFALASSDLKPFTNEQLREIYHCPDLELAKQFELEFLMSTLLESSESDPLYLELQEYYNLQGKLSSNVHDIKERRKECQNVQQQVWTREPVTRTFSANCYDNNLVSESITYE